MFELSGVNYEEVLEQGDSILVRVIASSSYRGFELSGLYCICLAFLNVGQNILLHAWSLSIISVFMYFVFACPNINKSASYYCYLPPVNHSFHYFHFFQPFLRDIFINLIVSHFILNYKFI